MPHAYKGWKSVFEGPGRGRKPDRSLVSLEDASPPPGAIAPDSNGSDSNGSGSNAPGSNAPDSNLSAVRLCARLEQHWYKDSTGFDLEKPKRTTPDDILAYEQRTGVRLPADMREYFQRLNGIDSAPGFFRFFPLAKLIPLKSQSYPTFNVDRYCIFADYMAGTWYYAIYLGEDSFLQNRVILPDLPSQPVLAHSFSDFVELYLADSPRLYGNQ